MKFRGQSLSGQIALRLGEGIWYRCSSYILSGANHVFNLF
jgi:hypothetical protein